MTHLRTTRCLARLLVGAALLLVLLPAAPARAEDEAEPGLDEAWHLLLVERKPDEAAASFQRLLDDPKLQASARARALLGLARCERLRGRREAAEKLIREVLDRYPEFEELRSLAGAQLEQTTQGRSRFVTGIVTLAQGQGLDLDTGGIFPGWTTFLDRANEILHGPGGLQPNAAATEVAGVAPKVAWVSDAPWHHMETDEGRTAYVQLLSEGRHPVVRFVTCVTGSGGILRDVSPAYCVGAPGRIQVHFEDGPPYTHFRVERRASTEGPFESLSTLEASPFEDAEVYEGTRYVYRITGVDAEGNHGVPTSTMATTASRGIRQGSVELRCRQWLDAATGRVTAQDGDLFLEATYGTGGGAGFRDAFGRLARWVDPQAKGPQSPWSAGSADTLHPYIPDRELLIVPLRGGGVLRGRVHMIAKPRSDGPQMRLEYLVNPDGPAFPTPLALEAARREGGIFVKAPRLPPGHELPFLVGEVVRGDGSTWRVPFDEVRGGFLDREAPPDTLIRYTGVPIGSGGRRHMPTVCVFNGIPVGVQRGTFRFHYHQGYSLETRSLVPASEADVVFADCAGGISSVVLGAEHGIVNLQNVIGKMDLQTRKGALFDAITGVDANAPSWSRRARGKEGRPPSDVFVLRTRSGGWAKLIIRSREDEGAWSERPITIDYAFNPHAPVFEEAFDTEPILTKTGVFMLPLELVGKRHREIGRAQREAALELVAKGLEEGTFQFHYEQGYSFKTRDFARKGDADVYFQTCAGGISSVTLESSGSIRSLYELTRPRGLHASVTALYEALVSVDPTTYHDLPSRSGSGRRSRGESRTPATDVFVLQTPRGEWVKLAIVKREDEGSWTQRPVTMRWILNPLGPYFAPAPESLEELPGVTLDSSILEHQAAREREAREGLQRALAYDDVLQGESFIIHLQGRYEVADRMPESMVLPRDRHLLIDGPLETRVEVPRRGAVFSTGGITPKGTVVLTSYSGVGTAGDMAGRIHVKSYAYVYVGGSLTGLLDIDSYATVVVEGDLVGTIHVGSYTHLLLRGELRGTLDFQAGMWSTFYFDGRYTRADLEAMPGNLRAVTLHVRSSDLAKGEHTGIGPWRKVIVGDELWDRMP